MSTFRVIGMRATRLTTELVRRILRKPIAKPVVNHTVRILARLPRGAPGPRPTGIISRQVWRAVRAGGYTTLRATTVGLLKQQNVGLARQRQSHFNGLLQLHARSTSGVVEKIRDIFSSNVRYNRNLVEQTYPTSLGGYELGTNIAVGCHAAVYKARLAKAQPRASKGLYDLFDWSDVDQPTTSAALVDSPAGTGRLYSPAADTGSQCYPLAVKIMFNYHFALPDFSVWNEMGPELVPIVGNQRYLNGLIRHFNPLPRSHPNIVKIHTAFVDAIPVLSDSMDLYPDAVPDLHYLQAFDLPPPRTMFIVMKRYRMTLREYMLSIKRRNYWNARVMFGQLLEGIVYLFEHKISHRDLKSDNILVDFDIEDCAPHLVVSDFGCCLSTGSFHLYYPADDVDLGGNLAMRPPEIRRTPPGRNVFLDYSKADLWAAGTIAYEIFTRQNPFYVKYKSIDYQESDVPDFPEKSPAFVERLVKQILKIDPKERPDPRIAANVLVLSLFRFGADLNKFLAFCGIQMRTLLSDSAEIWSRLDGLSELFAAETILSHGLKEVVSPAEVQLRSTFLSRFDNSYVFDALKSYLLVDEQLSEGSFVQMPPSLFSSINGLHGLASRVRHNLVHVHN